MGHYWHVRHGNFLLYEAVLRNAGQCLTALSHLLLTTNYNNMPTSSIPAAKRPSNFRCPREGGGTAS